MTGTVNRGAARRTLAAGAALALGWVLAGPAAAQAPLEYQVKAACLFNFFKFVQFPDAPAKGKLPPMTICIFGKDPFGTMIDTMLESRQTEGRSIQVHRHESAGDIHRAKSQAQLIYLSPSLSEADVALILEAVKTSPCLTVGETLTFCEQGGIINLRVKDNHVRFDVNPRAAEQAGLKISSHLLKLARLTPTSDTGAGAEK